jgi:hypothetical protein
MSAEQNRRQERGGPLGLAVIGHAFTGKVHSNAWRNVGSVFNVPAFEPKVLVGPDAAQVAAAASTYGWTEWATDWRRTSTTDGTRSRTSSTNAVSASPTKSTPPRSPTTSSPPAAATCPGNHPSASSPRQYLHTTMLVKAISKVPITKTSGGGCRPRNVEEPH